LIRSKIESVRSRPGLLPDVLLDSCVAQIRPLRSGAVVSKTVSVFRGTEVLGIRWQAAPERRADHRPSTGSRTAAASAQLAIGDYRDAADSLSSGMAEIPADQRDAEWMREYQQALTYADERS
jgi:hypothetical protein